MEVLYTARPVIFVCLLVIATFIIVGIIVKAFYMEPPRAGEIVINFSDPKEELIKVIVQTDLPTFVKNDKVVFTITKIGEYEDLYKEIERD